MGKKEISIVDEVEVTAAVCGQSCIDGNQGVGSPDDLEAIGQVFLEAAKMWRAGKTSGEIRCLLRGYGELASCTVLLRGFEFDWDKGPPVVLEIPHPENKTRSKRSGKSN